MSNITLKTLAKRTGFSVTTVSRALKNGPEINIKTREKVVKVANILNYQPNLYAYRLKMGKTFQICFFLNQLDDISNYEKQIIKGIFKSLNNSNYELIVKPIFRSNQVDAIREVVEKKLADGIIISHTTLNDERVKFLLEKNFPFVTHGRTELFSEHPYFDNDHADFIDKSLTYLKKKKCEEIIFIKPANKFTYNFISMKTFNKKVNELNLKISKNIEFSHEDSLEDLKNKITKKFSEKNNLKGIISGSDVRTLVVNSTLQKLGYSINKDVFVISKSFSKAPNYFFPKIPYFHEDMELTGYKLGDFLLKRISGSKINELQHVEKNKFIENNEITTS
tara:strand:+ start:2474 stop:3481 length:1008 start_codon:yes stop_codon:yes gene_type:complete